MENNKVQKILHLRSTALNEDNSPKLPEVNDIHYGEIAVNYHKGVETIAIKNNEDEITTFKSDKYYEEKYSTKTYADGKIFMGTQEEYQEAWKNGLITVGALVIIIEDSIDMGGGENSDSSETTSLLGKAILGKMILG